MARRVVAVVATALVGPVAAGSMMHSHIDAHDRVCASDNSSFTASGVDDVTRLLNTRGVAIVDSCVDQTVLANSCRVLCRHAPQAASQPSPHRTAATPKHVQSTRGRFHRTAFEDDDSKLAVADIRSAVEPFARAFFDASDTQWDDVYLSQCQFLTSLPQSEAQFYHQDNAARGLTMIIPLTSITLPMGPTQLLPGTHALTPTHDNNTPPVSRENAAASIATPPRRSTPQLLRALAQQPTCKAVAHAGQALMYDSRTLHRGMANMSDTPRPVLVLRYDHRATPPPGQGLAYTFMVRMLGAALHTCSYYMAPKQGRDNDVGAPADHASSTSPTIP